MISAVENERMTLGSCRECGKSASSQASVCPHCGVDAPIQAPQTIFDTIVALLKGLIALCIFLIAGNIGLNLWDSEKDKERVEQKCLNEYSLSSQQIAARKHFNTCWQYRNTPSSVWSDNQRKMMLAGEGCYSDDRDDPRYQDANWDLCRSR